MSGYTHCACRDCFELAIADGPDGTIAFCHDCVEAGCADEHAGTGECLVEPALPDDACPGCGCRPGHGLTAGCTHPLGCGYFREAAKVP